MIRAVRQRTPKPDRSDLRVQDLAKLLDTNPRRIEGWVEQGFLKPAHPGRGTGRPHRFTLENLATAYVMTELQRIHGDKSQVLDGLLSSEPAADYARTLSRWLRAAPSSEDVAFGSSPSATLALVRHADGTVEGRVEKGHDGRVVLDYLKRFVGDCVGITLLSPGDEFRAMQERLAEHD